MLFGKNRGCNFLTNNLCSERPEYCPTTNVNNINFYSTALGQCSTTTFISNCNIYTAYSNRVCKYSNY